MITLQIIGIVLILVGWTVLFIWLGYKVGYNDGVDDERLHVDLQGAKHE